MPFLDRAAPNQAGHRIQEGHPDFGLRSQLGIARQLADVWLIFER